MEASQSSIAEYLCAESSGGVSLNAVEDGIE